MADKNEQVEGKSIEQTPSEGTPPAPAEPASEVESLKTKVAELEKMVELYKDQFLRKAAEFENYKKRIESDYLKLTRFAAEDVIVELLPILDDLSRSLKSGRERRDFGPFYKGVELIYAKLIKILESRGVKPIDALGKQFDVDYHEALMQMPKEGVPLHTVIEEVEKGYLLHDKVIRHAKVIVAGYNDDQSTAVSEKKEEAPKKEENEPPRLPQGESTPKVADDSSKEETQ